MDRVVIVGASLAAVHAIEALRGNGHQGEIVLIGAEPHLPYDRPPLSKEGLFAPCPEFLRSPGWYQDQGVTVLLGRAAGALRATVRTVVLVDGTEVGYDRLIIATGSRVRTLPSGNEHIASLRTVDDAVALHARLAEAERVAVVGAGFLGLEAAATIAATGRGVTVVEVAPVPLARVLGDEAGDWFRDFHGRHGVTVHCGTRATSVQSGRSGYTVHTAGGTSIAADLVVGAFGAVPAIDWLRGSGIATSDGVLCDRSLRTSIPDVFAAGDVARWYNPMFDEDMRVEQWTNAVEQGRHVARMLLGADDAYAPIPYCWSDQFDARIRFIGRANGADEVHLAAAVGDSLVAVFGRGGVQVGALCVNATSQLPHHRLAIRYRRPIAEAVGS